MKIPLKEWLARQVFAGSQEAIADFGKPKEMFPAIVLPDCPIRFAGVI